MAKKEKVQPSKHNSQSKTIGRHKLLKPTVIFMMGVVVGLVVGYVFFNGSNASNAKSSEESKAQVQQRRTERAKQRYERAKQRIGRALKDNDLTKEQAEKLNAKIDELKKYREQNATSQMDWGEMRKKREELRQWAEENGVPSQYVITVF